MKNIKQFTDDKMKKPRVNNVNNGLNKGPNYKKYWKQTNKTKVCLFTKLLYRINKQTKLFEVLE